MCNGAPFTVEKVTPRAGIELGIARSVGQRLTYCANGAPRIMKVPVATPLLDMKCVSDPPYINIVYTSAN